MTYRDYVTTTRYFEDLARRGKRLDRTGIFIEDALMDLPDSDAQKILDTLLLNEEYHVKRDEMNAAIHRATGTVRFSPITSETIAQRERLQKLMQEQGVPM